MRRSAFGFLALATALVIIPGAFADPLIVGSVSVAGGNDKWDSSGSSVTFTTPSGIVVDSGGDLTDISNGTGATINNSTLTFADPDGLFFTTTSSGGNVATFNITGLADVTQPQDTSPISGGTGEYLDVSGTGILNLTGFAPTLASFSFDSTDSNQNYGATSSSWGVDITSEGVSPAPEPSSFFLLGTGLLTFAGVVRRKLVR